ncbi:3-oxoacyl-ACP reductase FabG [Candidatus Marithrix sp. Canyon 246]|uniref:3-oxoacyl-ACP reductase FabG n=1 Tax=Candidatus Marithrix sp. Canyon 246 TaxID=1827136 RepID=UPI000849ED75|nr:3-oxoacyl-ACP reductase FabG [Candidatus Marithrix sp. Canyon 246]
MNLDLTGEIALVTGASRGIGKGIALALAQAGAVVIGTATSSAGADNITEYLTDYQGEGKVLDITDTDSIKNLFDDIQSPSILVNNAGITRDSLFVRMKDDDWNAVIDANLSSVYRLSKAVLRPMTKARHGRIITITSIIGLTGNAGQTNYAAAKAGTIAFSKSLAKEVGSRNITVNTVAPGFIETDMTRGLIEKQQEAMLKNIPLNRIGNVDDIAAAVVFLASKASGYITGETIHVNGGMYMS